MVAFGIFGYFTRKCGYDPAPLVLAYVLGPLLEQGMRQSLIMSEGSFGIFLTRPISAASLIIGTFLLVMALLSQKNKKREGGLR
jgi:putative tricarboxylic transport membrane protein